jgi:group I intron endonuclease
MRGGIYRIVCLPSGHCYVGSSQDTRKRWHLHRCALRHGKHHSFVLQRAWDKHGEQAFTIEILEPVEDPGKLRAREQFWLDTLSPKYNLCPDANPAPTRGKTLGPLSEERRQKISEAVIGFRHTEEARTKMRGRRRPLRLTDSARALRAEQGKRRGFRGQTQATREKISNLQRGRKQSPESSRKRSIALTGKPCSQARLIAETTRKTNRNKGCPWSPSRRASQNKIRASTNFP